MGNTQPVKKTRKDGVTQTYHMGVASKPAVKPVSPPPSGVASAQQVTSKAHPQRTLNEQTKKLAQIKQRKVLKALHNAWSVETSANPDTWTPERPSTGQCVVTSLVLQDKLGGELMRTTVNGESHRSVAWRPPVLAPSGGETQPRGFPMWLAALLQH